MYSLEITLRMTIVVPTVAAAADAACTRLKSLCVIPHANRSICVMYGRFCFSHGDISLIYGTSPAKTATSGVRFEVFAACVCHM